MTEFSEQRQQEIIGCDQTVLKKKTKTKQNRDYS